MLLFAGLPFVLSAIVCALVCRNTKLRKFSDKQSRGKKLGVIARLADRNRLALCFGAAFLLMLVIAAAAGIACVKLSLSVQVYYVICGIAMGAVAGITIAVIAPPKDK